MLIPALGAAIYRPWLGVVAVFMSIPLLASDSAGFSMVEIAYMLLFVTSLVSWFMKHLTLGRLQLPKSLLLLSVFVFIGYLVATILLAIHREIPLQEWFQQWNTLASVVLIFPIVTEFRDSKRLFVLIVTFVTASTLVSVFGIGRALTGPGPIVEYAALGIPSTAYIWASIVIMGIMACVKRRSWWYFLLALLSINVGRMVLDVTRLPVGAMAFGLAIILGLSLIIPQVNKRVVLRFSKLAFWGVFALSLGMVFSPQPVFEVVDSYSQRLSWSSVERGLSKRYALAANEFAVWARAPVFGMGFGYETVIDSTKYRYGREFMDKQAHNLYVRLLARSGSLGTLLYLFVLLLILKEGWRAVWVTRGFDQGLALGLFASCVSFMAFAMLSSRGDRIEVQALLALAGGVFLLLQLKTKTRWHARPDQKRRHQFST